MDTLAPPALDASSANQPGPRQHQRITRGAAPSSRSFAGWWPQACEPTGRESTRQDTPRVRCARRYLQAAPAEQGAEQEATAQRGFARSAGIARLVSLCGGNTGGEVGTAPPPPQSQCGRASSSTTPPPQQQGSEHTPRRLRACAGDSHANLPLALVRKDAADREARPIDVGQRWHDGATKRAARAKRARRRLPGGVAERDDEDAPSRLTLSLC